MTTGPTEQTPDPIARYFAGNGVLIIDLFTPGVGWRPADQHEHLGAASARALHRQGFTAIAVAPDNDPTRGPADFTIAELLNH
jgi:hypothetical protein